MDLLFKVNRALEIRYITCCKGNKWAHKYIYFVYTYILMRDIDKLIIYGIYMLEESVRLKAKRAHKD